MSTSIESQTVDEKHRGNAAKLLLSAAVVLVGLATVTVTSLALFTDSAAVGANVFTTGTIDINATPASAVVTMPAMAPGDQVTAPLTVSNDGTLELRYAIESTTTEDVLAGELVLTVKSGVTTCDDANWAADGTTLYAGQLGSTGTDAIVGLAAAGIDAGDRVLVASTNEVLCLNVTLPLASTAGQGVTTTATLDFLAEQTANNP
jgi:predicted ribosomally synthesized peptide with SipW-like signal peptide